MDTLGHGSTHVGRRPQNQDAFCVDPEHGLYVVADGIGGYEGGEVASRLAVSSLRELVRTVCLETGDPDDTWQQVDRVKMLVRSVNRRVARDSVGRLANMCTTLAAVLFVEGRAIVTHVGDSRVYLLRDGALSRLTRDHSVVAEMEMASGMRVSASVELRLGHIVTQYLGAGASPIPDVRILPTRPGDRFLLCSDGLTDALDDLEIGSILGDDDLGTACERLVWGAYNAGGTDNVTAVIASVP